jgi:hypothetical protein
MGRSNRFKLWHLAALTTIAAIPVAAMAYTNLNKAPERDASNCRIGQSPPATTVLIADSSDALSTIHRDRLNSDIDRARDNLSIDGKLVLLALHPDVSIEELFGRCNPGSAASELTQNARKVRRHYEEAFADPLEAARGRMVGGAAAKQSQLIEAITLVTQRADFDARIPNRTLIVASDMLQHTTGGYSHYAKGDIARAFEKSALAIGDQADLSGVAVVVDYFTRPDQRTLQGPRHRAFWEAWFRERGAASVTFLGVPATSGT